MSIATGTVGEGQNTARRVVFLHAAAFVLGFSVVFVALGALLGALGSAFQNELIWFQRVAGVLLVILGLHLAEVITIPLLYRSFQVGGPGGSSTAASAAEPSRARAAADYGRSLVVGVAFSVGWTPCVGPILAGILVLALDSASLIQAIILLICYAAGLGIPFLIVGATFGASTQFLRKLNRWMPLIGVVSGVLLVFVGMLIALDRVVVLNEALGSFGVDVLAGSDGSSTQMLDLNAGSAAIAFAGGFVSFISPCVLPLVPIYLGHLAGIGSEQASIRAA
ncbi:MAG: cytochrome c biogenesis protein CcdA [Chloroflexota bacterium]|nr:cytochrome c biogenesis protein CcdA [Chloroflexota bacterium]MDE2896043.1 cytochrome c biogenesis protein CcdA [Chloroflexota bacterium]